MTSVRLLLGHIKPTVLSKLSYGLPVRVNEISGTFPVLGVSRLHEVMFGLNQVNSDHAQPLKGQRSLTLIVIDSLQVVRRLIHRGSVAGETS